MKQEEYTITSASATGTRAVIKSMTRTVTADHHRQNQSANSNVVNLAHAFVVSVAFLGYHRGNGNVAEIIVPAA